VLLLFSEAFLEESQPTFPITFLPVSHSFQVWEGFPCEVSENMARRHLEKQAKA
jgi:hypothetical protein